MANPRSICLPLLRAGLLAWFVLGFGIASLKSEPYTVLPDLHEGGKTKAMMNRYLRAIADRLLAERQAAVERLSTQEEIAAYQQRLKNAFLDQLGGFPSKSPLNARIIRSLPGDGCLIECILFESQPQHFVAATLYLPRTKPPFPAVLIPCGHSDTGKAANQQLGMFLAQNGLAAFTYDPIGQGERYQILAKDGKPLHRSTTEHSLVGVGSILVGRNTATYRVWDGIRALDYLESRSDIDAGRLGCTGISGGGTLTEYLMAIDDRIQCAAPGCAPMPFKTRLATIGPGDAEQNVFAQIKLGLDHGDYTLMRAPKPTLFLAATQDYVDIGGTWELFREASRVYAKLGYWERVALVETDAKHGFSLQLREGSARWMRRWLLGRDEPIHEPASIEILEVEKLWCSPSGQVQQLPGARSVIDLNLELVDAWSKTRQAAWTPENRSASLQAVRRLIGVPELAKLEPPQVRLVSTAKHPDYELQKLYLEPEPGIWLPAVLFKPARIEKAPLLVLHEAGKASLAGDAARIEKWMASGQPVMSLDLRGLGETGAGIDGMWGGNFDDLFTAYLVGQSFLGMRCQDVWHAARYLEEQGLCAKGKPHLLTSGITAHPALHAVALEPQLFSRLEMEEPISSWREVVRDPNRSKELVNVVHGALRLYDLPDLVATLPPSMVVLGSKRE